MNVKNLAASWMKNTPPPPPLVQFWCQEELYGLFPPPALRVFQQTYVCRSFMCFLIRCKRGPLRQGPPLPPPPILACPFQPAASCGRPSCLRGGSEQQIGAAAAISWRHAHGADALSPNRFLPAGRGDGVRRGGRSPRVVEVGGRGIS